jgi:radical SAM protein with 4Fe4S-binding SPASM domain
MAHGLGQERRPMIDPMSTTHAASARRHYAMRVFTAACRVGGEVHPCSQAPIIRPEYVVGNLKTQSLAEILSGDALRAFGAGVPHASCTRCWAPSNVPRELLQQLILARGEAGSP